jgi:hypothetical protein
VGGAGIASELLLLRRRDGTDDPAAEPGDDLGQEQTDATGGGVYQHGVTRLDRVAVVREVVRGHAL